MINKKSNKAIALLTKYPTNIWLNFLNNFNNYDIFIIIDDNSKDFSKLFGSLNSKINFIQIDDNYAKSKGFYCNGHVPSGSLPGKPISWDKSLMYFSLINNNYDYVWFMEDDVLFLKEDVLQNIDFKYPNSDLLTPSNNIINNYDLWTWELKYTIKDILKLPICTSMICACRISNKLLHIIKNYRDNNNILAFYEAMFNTLAYQNNCKIDTPDELSTIHYRTSWDLNNLNLNNLYHPVKNIDSHIIFRNNNNNTCCNLFNNVDYSQNFPFHFSEYNFLKNYLPNNFNFSCYRENNSDLKHFSDEEIVIHWIFYGKFENRKYKLKNIYPDFNHNIYRKKNYDLYDKDKNELETHFLNFGRYESRLYK